MQYFGDNGLIKKAQEAKTLHEQGREDEEKSMNALEGEYDKIFNEMNLKPLDPSVPEKPTEPEVPKGPNGKPLINKDTVNTTNHEKIIGEDSLGNQIVVPKGFKIGEESGTTVKEGIIIEDDIGNQFVWIPVSNIDGSGSNKIKVDSISEEGIEITLGRYTFATSSPGTPTIVQKGSEYANTVSETNTDEKYKIKHYTGDYYFYEFSQSRLTNYKEDPSGNNKGTNTTALNLKAFIESVKDHHGYYIARYEASFGSGEVNPEASKLGTAEYITNQKPLSKKSTKHTRASNTEKLETGILWNCINQGDAAKASRNMYTGTTYGVESDLVNSYMWDTAIVYIQAMGNSNYANANRDTNGNTSLKNTGETGDEKCHIYDMAGNTYEWTTEYSTYTYNGIAYFCTLRGGYCGYSSNFVAYRNGNPTTISESKFSFRVGLYVK